MSRVIRISEELANVLQEVSRATGKRISEITYIDLYGEKIMRKLDNIEGLLVKILEGVQELHARLAKREKIS